MKHVAAASMVVVPIVNSRFQQSHDISAAGRQKKRD